MTRAEARRAAQQLQEAGRYRGPSWGPIIEALGFDPRTFTGSRDNPTLTLSFDAQNTLQPGLGNIGPISTPTPTPAAPAPAAPAAPAPPPMPGAEYDSAYNNDLAAAEAAYQSSMARIGLGESRLAFDTGFGRDGQVDLSNPYSQAMMLQRFKEQAGRGINNSMAASGQLYSGARQRAQNENSFQYERNRSNLQTSAQRGYQDFGLAAQDAANARTDAGYGAAANQAERWRNARNDWYALYGS